MNRLLLVLNAILFAAVLFLFYKVFATESPVSAVSPAETTEKVKEQKEEPGTLPEQKATPPTGKIAYINIDKLNEQSLEVKDLIAESKRRRNLIETSLENLSVKYQEKVEDFQTSQKAGIAPESQMRAKAEEIGRIEQEAQSKQMQMDELTMEITEKNNKFQSGVRDFLVKWNNGRYDYILTFSEALPTMLLGNSTFEITDEVIAKLNEEYSQRKKSRK